MKLKKSKIVLFEEFLKELLKKEPILLESLCEGLGVIFENNVLINLDQAVKIASDYYTAKNSPLYVFSLKPEIYDEVNRKDILNEINKVIFSENVDKDDKFRLYRLMDFIKSVSLTNSSDFYTKLADKVNPLKKIH